MDAPPIQYARTADGVNIANWTLGEGPLLFELRPISHIRMAWTPRQLDPLELGELRPAVPRLPE